MGNKGNLGAQTCLRERRTLGEIKADGFEQDVCINDRHQAFSAEIHRLALLGVGGVGYVASRALAAGSSGESAPRMGGAAKGLPLIAAASFGLSAASALCLRYLAFDSVAFQLRIVRLRNSRNCRRRDRGREGGVSPKPPFEGHEADAGVFVRNSGSGCRRVHCISVRRARALTPLHVADF